MSLVVDQAPEFPGGEAALMQFLVENVKYPVEAMEKCVQGRVVVEFTVNEDGTLSDWIVTKSVDPDLDKEAIRLIQLMPKWNPGRSKGKVVRSRYTLPVMLRMK